MKFEKLRGALTVRFGSKAGNGVFAIGPKKQKPDRAGRERPSGYYDEIYRRSTEYRKPYSESMYYYLWCVLVDRMRPGEMKCVLDIGCGPGQLAAFMHDRGLPAYVGLDFSEATIEMARRACPQYQFVCEDVFTSKVFNDVPYDAVVLTEFLEHIEKDVEILGRIRPGARVYGTVPNFPDPGHVRCFESCQAVAARYASLLDGWRVDEFPAVQKGRKFFLFEGRKKS